jgi:hypothetical protein
MDDEYNGQYKDVRFYFCEDVPIKKLSFSVGSIALHDVSAARFDTELHCYYRMDDNGYPIDCSIDTLMGTISFLNNDEEEFASIDVFEMGAVEVEELLPKMGLNLERMLQEEV